MGAYMPIHLPPISRRDFLAKTLAVGTGLVLSDRLFAKETAGDQNHFLLLSDIHIAGNRDTGMLGVNPFDGFQQATREILSLSDRPPRAIVSGDCAYLHGLPEDYARFREAIQPLREAGMAMHFALGNHDKRRPFCEAFPDVLSPAIENLLPNRFVSVLETEYANWFLLDSLEETNYAIGKFGESQLNWLAKTLDARKDKPAILVGHHNPNVAFVPCLLDTKEFSEIISSHKHVQAYIFGHTHTWDVGRLSGAHAVNLPTTAWTFKLNGDHPRGFVTARLRSDGISLTLHSLDHKHEKHGQQIDLRWR
jgi:3',5'-cyclic AMP phosphodiesterase CpdA